MTRRDFLGAPAFLRAAPRPNILVILADDLGCGDIACYGCPDVKTPHIDSLARDGVRFTQFYASAPECTPTRTAFLTGRYPQRAGGLECAIGVGNVGRYDEAVWLRRRGELGLPSSEESIGQVLRRSGYDTALIGKWHLGYEPKFGPEAHGFQHSFGVLGGNADYFRHTEEDGSLVLFENGKPVRRTGYLTDLLAAEAVRWIQARHSAPFFLYLAFTAPHSPYQAPGDEDKPAPRKGTRETYIRMIERMDQGIGHVLGALGTRASDTIVIFTSDNGGTGVGRNAPWRGSKSQLWEGGIRVPALIRWPGRIAAGSTRGDVAMTMDLTATLLAAAAARPTRRLDGVDLMQPVKTNRTVFWRYKRLENRRAAVRSGDWKLVVENGKPFLHHLAQDPAESVDLTSSQPERVRKMTAMLAEWERETFAPRLKDFPRGAA